jgi:hypothetical protein
MAGSWEAGDLPNLTDGVYAITSCYDTRYNCIAWAANDTTAWWQPIQGDGIYWPGEAPTDDTIWAYAAAFATLGYAECSNASLEDGCEKIALFAVLEDDEFIATHAARQLIDGKWTSKLGDFEDVTHATLEAVCCDAYGVDLLYMKRPRAKP